VDGPSSSHLTDTRILVKIYDADENVYQVPNSVVPRPKSQTLGSAPGAELEFSVIENPFSFMISRRKTKEVLFDTSDSDLIFQSQYLSLRTKLPSEPNIYGLGESTDNMRLNRTNYIRTLWSRDAPDVPPGTNLYGE
jgi:alpha-glucosidase